LESEGESMDWQLIKTGADMFDMLHAYGMGIVLSHASGLPVQLKDAATAFELTCPLTRLPCASVDILDEVLALPTSEEVLAYQSDCQREVSLRVGNLDGLLALLFTSPGVRASSVKEVQWKSRRDSLVAEQAMKKVRSSCDRWKEWVNRQTSGANSWLEQLLSEYNHLCPAIPVPAIVSSGKDLSLLMTIDPTFSYSTRRPTSDGFVAHKTNVAIRGTHYAVLLSYIGAARFLRTMAVKGDLVMFFVPMASSIRLSAETCLPLLAPANYTPEQSLILQWLEYGLQSEGQTQWRGIAFQEVQTQGAQQSIPRERGHLDLSWCADIQPSTLKSLFGAWRRLLSSERERHPYDTDHLLDSLRTRSAKVWADHLYDVAQCVHHKSSTEVHAYRFEAVKEVTVLMNASTPSKLAEILERKVGTLRFGQALRLLGQINAAALRDLTEELESVQTLDRLLLVLAQVAQDCQVAAAKSPFIVVPTEEDLKYLLEDLEQVGVQTIARFLIILSALRYPRLDESELDAQRLSRVNRLLLASLTAALPLVARENDTLAFVDPGTVNVPEIHIESIAEQDGVQL
jgi:hypothetical protein